MVNIWVLNWVAITSRPISKKEDWREACWAGEMPKAWNQGHGRIPPSWCPGWTWRTHPAARREACYPGLKKMTTPEYVSSTLFFTGRMTWHIVSFISSQWYLLSVNDLLKFFWLHLHSMWNLSSLTRDQTHTPALESGVLTTGPPGKPHCC